MGLNQHFCSYEVVSKYDLAQNFSIVLKYMSSKIDGVDCLEGLSVKRSTEFCTTALDWM